jgi:hypothetical protein
MEIVGKRRWPWTAEDRALKLFFMHCCCSFCCNQRNDEACARASLTASRRRFLKDGTFSTFVRVKGYQCIRLCCISEHPLVPPACLEGATLEIPLPIAYSSRNLGHVARPAHPAAAGLVGHSNCNYFICVKTSGRSFCNVWSVGRSV